MPLWKNSSPDLPQLAAKAQLGDRESLDRLLAALQLPLYSHIVAIIRNRESAEDILQDTLFTIAKKLGQLSDPNWVRAWAYRIANRKAIRRAQRESREEALFPELEFEGIDTVAGTTPIDFSEIESMVETLPPASRIVIRMHYLEQMSFVEIGEALEVPVGTVKSRLAYGLGVLRKGIARLSDHSVA